MVLVTGMIIGTAFTLFMVPAIYTYVARDKIVEDDDEVELNRSEPKLTAMH
jgi:hypothetical protein